MNPLFTQFATEETAEKTGLAVLGLDPKAFLLQLATFVLLYFLLRKFAFESIVKMLDERRRKIDDGVRLGVEMEKEKAKFDEEVAAKMAAARKEADKILHDAEAQSSKMIKEAEDKATAKAAKVLADAEAKIADDIARTRASLKGELAQLVADATEVLINEKLDASKDAKLIEQALAKRSN